MCGFRMPEFQPPPPNVKAADLVEVRRGEADDTKRARLDRFVLDAMRAGRKAWSAAHRWKGTYGDLPPREWMVSAERDANDALAAERTERERAEAPLFAGVYRT